MATWREARRGKYSVGFKKRVVAEALVPGASVANIARAHGLNVPVLALEADPDGACDQVIEEIVAAVTEDAVQIIALGCGGMVDIADKAAGKVDVKLIDGVRAAALIASGLS